MMNKIFSDLGLVLDEILIEDWNIIPIVSKASKSNKKQKRDIAYVKIIVTYCDYGLFERDPKLYQKYLAFHPS